MTDEYHPNIEKLFDQMSGVEWWILDILITYSGSWTCRDLVYEIYTDEKPKTNRLLKKLDADVREGVKDLQKHGIPVLIGPGDVVQFDPNSDRTCIFILEWRNYWDKWNQQVREKMRATN